MKKLGLRSPRLFWFAALALAAVLALAWIDGGEEALHPIVQDVTLPGAQA